MNKLTRRERTSAREEVTLKVANVENGRKRKRRRSKNETIQTICEHIVCSICMLYTYTYHIQEPDNFIPQNARLSSLNQTHWTIALAIVIVHRSCCSHLYTFITTNKEMRDRERGRKEKYYTTKGENTTKKKRFYIHYTRIKLNSALLWPSTRLNFSGRRMI